VFPRERNNAEYQCVILCHVFIFLYLDLLDDSLRRESLQESVEPEDEEGLSSERRIEPTSSANEPRTKSSIHSPKKKIVTLDRENRIYPRRPHAEIVRQSVKAKTNRQQRCINCK